MTLQLLKRQNSGLGDGKPWVNKTLLQFLKDFFLPFLPLRILKRAAWCWSSVPNPFIIQALENARNVLSVWISHFLLWLKCCILFKSVLEAFTTHRYQSSILSCLKKLLLTSCQNIFTHLPSHTSTAGANPPHWIEEKSQRS